VAMSEIKGVSKDHWMRAYLKRVASKEGLSAEEIYEEENARRAREGIPLLKFNSIGRTLDTQKRVRGKISSQQKRNRQLA